MDALTEGRLDRLFIERARRGIAGPDRRTRAPWLANELLARLGTELPSGVVVVTGSKGKGSTIRYLASLLDAAGRRVGWLSSPHLLEFRERIRIGADPIDETAFARHLARVEPAFDALAPEAPAGRYLGPHAGILAIALGWFAEQGVETVLAEAGRGGEWDEVVILRPSIAILTNALREHPAELGRTPAAIARTKARVLPPGGTLLAGSLVPSALSAVERAGRGRAWRFERVGEALGARRAGGRARLSTPLGERAAELPLGGDYQAENAVLALRAAELVTGTSLDPELVGAALGRIRHPGRLTEHAFGAGRVLLDATVERESAAPVAEWLDSHRGSLIAAVPADKDPTGVLRALAPHADRILLARTANRLLHFDPELEARLAARHGASGLLPDGAAAVRHARAAGGDWALVGTLSFIAEASRELGVDAMGAWRAPS